MVTAFDVAAADKPSAPPMPGMESVSATAPAIVPITFKGFDIANLLSFELNCRVHRWRRRHRANLGCSGG